MPTFVFTVAWSIGNYTGFSLLPRHLVNNHVHGHLSQVHFIGSGVRWYYVARRPTSYWIRYWHKQTSVKFETKQVDRWSVPHPVNEVNKICVQQHPASEYSSHLHWFGKVKRCTWYEKNGWPDGQVRFHTCRPRYSQKTWFGVNRSCDSCVTVSTRGETLFFMLTDRPALLRCPWDGQGDEWTDWRRQFHSHFFIGKAGTITIFLVTKIYLKMPPENVDHFVENTLY